MSYMKEMLHTTIDLAVEEANKQDKNMYVVWDGEGSLKIVPCDEKGLDPEDCVALVKKDGDFDMWPGEKT